ncbi:MAG TPA: phosphoribosylaminoimidazolesuccinocarboxamide synthase, partial [Steroidobacteraceae bacterium]|nr:phosphoribosylaminoimidazolesuccinocarboxamide synthase [Steroidobacteraceae bacterium]
PDAGAAGPDAGAAGPDAGAAGPDAGAAGADAAAGQPLFETQLSGLTPLHRGKVRDLYRVDEDHMLIVTTDRFSAFDVVLPDAIPGRARVLQAISLFWFARTRALVPNHLTERALGEAVPDARERAALEGRALIVRRLRPLPIEAVVRGYLAGSGWRDYQSSGRVCGIPLPPGLRQAQALPEPIFTPATKAALGEHDQNISFEAVAGMLGAPLAAQVRDTALALYRMASAHALARGIIIADTKFEFGLDREGRLTLIDEVLTPDSSRFWPADTWRVGTSPPSFDKQHVRDYLETLHWDKRPPAPHLPREVIEATSAKYREALQRLTLAGE